MSQTERNKADYISLSEAAAHSPYTQEYLSLRARQGKLRAVKQGRNWVTTLGWLDDYLQQVDESRSLMKEATVVHSSGPALDQEFSFHPAASVDIKQSQPDPDPTEPLGSLMIEEPELAAKSTFSWEDHEEPTFSQADQKLFSHLQAKVDAALEKNGPAIRLAESDASQHTSSDQPIRVHSYWEKQQAEMAAAEAQADPRELEEPVGKSLRNVLRPAMAMAVTVLLISSLIIFDKSLKIGHYVTLGAATLMSDIGNELVAIGIRQEAGQTGLGKVSADTIATQPARTYTTGGQVAGLSTQNQDPGFWATVWLGLQTIIGTD